MGGHMPIDELTHTVIPVRADKLLAWLTEVGRHRALTDEESLLVEEIVRSENDETEFQWTEDHDRMLLAASRRKGIHRLARELGVTDGAAYQRLSRVRKRQRVKVRGRKQEGK